MSTTMHKFALVLACWALTCHGRRMQRNVHSDQDPSQPVQSLANFLLASNPSAAFSPGGAPSGSRIPRSRPGISDSQPTVLGGKSHLSSDDEAVAEALNKVNDISQKMVATVMAAGLALGSNVDWAKAAEAAQDAAAQVSPYAKVDKTGPIGAVASFIEGGIDQASSALTAAGVPYSYGLSIVFFTLLVKVLTSPLQIQQVKTSTMMQKMQPLQAKIAKAFPGKGQEEQKNQLMASVFQNAKVNPLAGCLPSLAQIPIFISLYRALNNLVAEDKLTQSFLWIPDLEGPLYGKPSGEALNWITSAFTLNPELGWVNTACFLTIPIILIFSQSLSMRILTPPKPEKLMTDQEKTTQAVAKVLPFGIAFFSLSVPAGLSLYWIVNNLLTTLSTVIVRKTVTDKSEMPDEVLEIEAWVDRRLNKGKKVAPAVATSGFGGASGVMASTQPAGDQLDDDEEEGDPAIAGLPSDEELARVDGPMTRKKKRRPKKTRRR